jgi:DNA-binding Lrp family transcriptional regulator
MSRRMDSKKYEFIKTYLMGLWVRNKMQDFEIDKAEILKRLGISEPTFYNYRKRMRKEGLQYKEGQKDFYRAVYNFDYDIVIGGKQK